MGAVPILRLGRDVRFPSPRLDDEEYSRIRSCPAPAAMDRGWIRRHGHQWNAPVFGDTAALLSEYFLPRQNDHAVAGWPERMDISLRRLSPGDDVGCGECTAQGCQSCRRAFAGPVGLHRSFRKNDCV